MSRPYHPHGRNPPPHPNRPNQPAQFSPHYGQQPASYSAQLLQYPSGPDSFPQSAQPNTYFDPISQSPSPAIAIGTNPALIHKHTAIPINAPLLDRPQPPPFSGLPQPPSQFIDSRTISVSPGYPQQELVSPLDTPLGPQPLVSGSSSSSAVSEYFPSFSSTPDQAGASSQHPFLADPSWRPEAMPFADVPTPLSRSNPRVSPEGGSKYTAKTSRRQQFTACGACRHRRIKCDLTKRQEEAMRLAAQEDSTAAGTHRSGSKSGRSGVSCTNCIERGTNCV